MKNLANYSIEQIAELTSNNSRILRKFKNQNKRFKRGSSNFKLERAIKKEFQIRFVESQGDSEER